MSEERSYKLPLYIYSATQIQFFIHQLRKYQSLLTQNKLRSKYKLSSGETIKLEDEFFPEVKQFLLDTFDKTEDIEGNEIKNLISFFENIQKEAPRFSITTANILNEDAKENIVKWLRANIHEICLVSFHYQKNIVGGFILRTPNHIYDFSIRDNLKNPSTKVTDLI